MRDPHILLIGGTTEVQESLKKSVENSRPSAHFTQTENKHDAIRKANNVQFNLVIIALDLPLSAIDDLIQTLNELSFTLRPAGYFVITKWLTPKENTATNKLYFKLPLETQEIESKLKLFFNPEASLPKSTSNKPQIDIEFINPFIDSTLNVLKLSCRTEASKEQVFIRGNEQISGDISAIIAMNSQQYLGSMAISFDESCFLSIVSNMLGETYTEVTPDIQDAAAEVCNQIFGGAKKVLNERGHSIQPAIPSVVTGRNHSIKHVIQGFCIAVKFSTQAGNFQVEAVMKYR